MSLFENGCCNGNNVSEARRPHSKGCIFDLLNNLANPSLANLCEVGNPQKLLIKQKGTSEPVCLFGADATVFTLVEFDPDTGLAIFSFEEVVGTTPMTIVERIFIEDAANIAGIFLL